MYIRENVVKTTGFPPTKLTTRLWMSFSCMQFALKIDKRNEHATLYFGEPHSVELLPVRSNGRGTPWEGPEECPFPPCFGVSSTLVDDNKWATLQPGGLVFRTKRHLAAPSSAVRSFL